MTALGTATVAYVIGSVTDVKYIMTRIDIDASGNPTLTWSKASERLASGTFLNDFILKNGNLYVVGSLFRLNADLSVEAKTFVLAAS